MPSGRRLGSTATRFLRYLLPLCMLAATVVAGMGLLRVIGRSDEPALSQTAVSLTLGGPSHPASPTPTAPTPTAASAPAARPTAASTSQAAPAAVRVTSPVAVYNASAIHGLATRTAELLREKGITISAVDNLVGTQKLSEATVFYAPGLQAQARTLAGLIGATAVAPAPAWIPAGGKLVLVVTDSSTISASAS